MSESVQAIPPKSCPKCRHPMEVVRLENGTPKLQWGCLCGWTEPLYGRAEEGEP